MSNNKTSLLLVEDDLNLGFLLTDFLEMQGFSVKLCKDGEAGLKTFNQGGFDLCIIDGMLPVKDGFTLAAQIRAQDKKVPIIFLTAKSMKEDKLKGFSIGADDYITKPFEEDELLYRIKAVLRRTMEDKKEEPKQEHFTLGKFKFDYSTQSLIFRDTIKRLTEKESEVLRLLCINKNRILKREDALVGVWGQNDYFLGRSLDVFITKLRKYLKDDPSISIENVHGVGFMLKTE
jgi:DNA-binding response OmpR family regulator